MDDHSLPAIGVPDTDRRNRFAIPKIVCINARSSEEFVMPGLFDVSKETILITGASQGLGRQFARVLAAHGAAVVLAARQTAKLKSLEEEIRGQGGRAAAVQMDVTDIASIATAVDGAEAALGPVSVLINNAGIAIEKLAVDQTEADWDSVINANLKGAYFLATEMARRMIARNQEGNIVNIASVLGQGVMKFLSPYTISKAGIIQATKAMALELAGNRIRVNALAPGYIDTEMNHDFWSTQAGEKLTKRIPQRRVGAESDLDGAILLLASSASRYMTGTVVTVDGGFLLV
jgi:3-oxoacyl-[acyl-carrier protein] reductase